MHPDPDAVNPDPNPVFHFNADQDLAPYPSEVILRPLLVYRLYKAPISSLRASFMSAHDHPRHYFDPLKLLNFDINADPDPAIHCNVDPDPAITLMRIRI